MSRCVTLATPPSPLASSSFRASSDRPRWNSECVSEALPVPDSSTTLPGRSSRLRHTRPVGYGKGRVWWVWGVTGVGCVLRDLGGPSPYGRKSDSGKGVCCVMAMVTQCGTGHGHTLWHWPWSHIVALAMVTQCGTGHGHTGWHWPWSHRVALAMATQGGTGHGHTVWHWPWSHSVALAMVTQGGTGHGHTGWHWPWSYIVALAIISKPSVDVGLAVPGEHGVLATRLGPHRARV
eukprot:366230-Chlamydomonas_euryale.AAC.16